MRVARIDLCVKSLEKSFAKIQPVSLDTVCYGIVSEKHDSLNSNGSLLVSGRYNNRQFLVLYFSESKEVCFAEKERKTTIKTKSIYKIAKIKAKLKKVLDLTNSDNLKKLSVKKEELISEDWSIPQHIATLAFQKGDEAILVPSATRKGNNLVIFPENYSKGSIVDKTLEETL